MNKQTLGFKILTVFGILAGVWSFSCGMLSKDNLFLFIGGVTITLSIGILYRQKWAKIAMYIFSAMVIYLNLVWLSLALGDTFMFIAILSLAPVTGFCFYSSIFLAIPKTKK